MFLVIFKRLRRARMKLMGKPNRGSGKARGNSPYNKYQKKPYRYSAEYYAWKRQAMGNKGPKTKDRHGKEYRDYLQAAE